ncbi:MAG: peptidase [Cyclobacteriaceae bacterium]|nr:MAG: peptidase [Cyclobacteriaceae bacterium]
MVKRGSVFFFALFLVAACSEDNGESSGNPVVPDEVDLSTSFYYQVDLTDRSDDTFKVRMYVDNLSEDNKVYQFPATVPGVYDIFDIGRFVVSFKAFDEAGVELGAVNISTNQWELSDPVATRMLEFEVKETFDTPVTEHPLYKMGGTSMEEDHVLLNAFDVLGYPTGLKERDFYLDVERPSGWKIATSLPKTAGGLYYAEDYDKFVDSPIIVGDITVASVLIDGAKINVNTYSEADQISAGQVLNDVEQVMEDASAFLKGLPVDHYNFIYFFYNGPGSGALEHSYSSVYVLNDRPYTASYGNGIRDISAHEFFHIVTPLNIHSEIIEDFNFAEPTASQHLWLYEGVTEWASLMMQYRNGSYTTPGILNEFRFKKNSADDYDQNMSLTVMSQTCYTPEGGAQFGNVYQKGALVAALLDIRLLELSDGERGLRELILELIDVYGPNNAFSEENFFDDLVDRTYPEIAGFIDLYIKGTAPLPMEEYFNKIGVDFIPETNSLNEMAAKTTQQQFLFDKWKVNL